MGSISKLRYTFRMKSTNWLILLALSCKPAENTLPTAQILQPGNGDSVSLAAPITLAGSVADLEDAPPDLLAVWSSDLDGMLFDDAPDAQGVTRFDTQELSVGQHVITLTVTDTVGADSFASVLLIVTPGQTAPTLEITAPDADELGRTDEAMTFEATVADPDDAVADLLVAVSSDQDGELCAPTPDADGRVSCDAILSEGPHTLTFTVTDPAEQTATATVSVLIEDSDDLDDDDDGYTEAEGDCDDLDFDVNPDATETPNGLDDDCDGIKDNGTDVADDDLDGFSEQQGDCDDDDDTVHPDASESPNDVDDDCDGTKDEGTSRYDDDGDCFCPDTVCSSSSNSGCPVVDPGDCNDNADDQYPGATETPGDGFDSDCDNAERCFVDGDGDQHGTSTLLTSAYLDCSGSGESALDDDCDDAEASVYPSAPETLADGIDQDCSGGDACFTDVDLDTYGTATPLVSADLDCTDPGEASLGGDCDDVLSAIHPTASEVVGDGVDQDCDTTELCRVDSDKDAFAAGTGTIVSVDLVCATADGEAPATAGTDCNDANGAIHPSATEITGSGVDENCDAREVCYVDFDRDGARTSATVNSPDAACTQSNGEALTGAAIDCADTNAAIRPGATEIIGNEIDENCDSKEVCYVDVDDDDYGKATSTVVSADTDCTDPGEGRKVTDCNDSDKTSYPSAPQICSLVDHNCDGTLDGDLDKDGDLTTACGGQDCDDTNPAITAATCTTKRSCKDWRSSGSTSDGIYTIDADGPGGAAPYPVTCEMNEDGGGWERCYTFTNSAAEDLTGNSWFDKCVDTAMASDHIGLEVRVALHDNGGTSLYSGFGARPSPWTYDNLTSTAGNTEQFYSDNHIAPPPLGRIVPLNNGDKLMIPGRFSQNGGYGGSFGDGYAVIVYPNAPNYFSNVKLLVAGYRGGVSGSVRSFSNWTPAQEITFAPGTFATGPPPIPLPPGVMGTFDFYVR